MNMFSQLYTQLHHYLAIHSQIDAVLLYDSKTKLIRIHPTVNCAKMKLHS